MDNKFNSILSVALIPQTVALIIKNDNFSEIDALNKFYQSKVYELLSKEETKLWHYSPLTVYNMWKQESETGKVIFPEG
jgi:hypothetical protein